MIELIPRSFSEAVVTVPGSKSYTHRILIAAALSDGLCRIENALHSEDTLLTLNALRKMGIVIEEEGATFAVHGKAGALQECAEPIYLGNSGTSMRLLSALSAFGRGTCLLTGTARMQQARNRRSVRAPSISERVPKPAYHAGVDFHPGET